MSFSRTYRAVALALFLPVAGWAEPVAPPLTPPSAPPATASIAAISPAAGVTLGLYATMNVNLQWTEQPSVARREYVSTDSSNIGVRGAAVLTDWLNAELQCETSANVNGLSVSGICNRNSRVGLGGKYGSLWYGNWDTPFKSVAYGTKVDDPFLDTDVWGYQSIMGSPGFNYRSSGWKTAQDTAITGFDVRASNSVGYWSPVVYGLMARLQYSPNTFRSADGTISPQLYSAALIYNRGPLSVLAGYENHKDGFALATANTGTTAATRAFGATAANVTSATTNIAPHMARSTDWAWRVGAGYELVTPAGATTLGVLLEQLQLAQDEAPTGAVKDFKRFAWQVGLKHRIGGHELRARYSVAGEGECELVGGGVCSTTGYGANMLALGYAYHFAKSTQVYLHWGRIRNGENAQYTFGVGGAPDIAGKAKRGDDPRALGLGIRVSI